jgi:hypothetical protein
MHQRYQGVAEHFLLAKRQEQDISPSQAGLVIEVFLFAQKDVPADLSDVLAEPPDGDTGCQDKQNLLKERHTVILNDEF